MPSLPRKKSYWTNKVERWQPLLYLGNSGFAYKIHHINFAVQINFYTESDFLFLYSLASSQLCSFSGSLSHYSTSNAKTLVTLQCSVFAGVFAVRILSCYLNTTQSTSNFFLLSLCFDISGYNLYSPFNHFT